MRNLEVKIIDDKNHYALIECEDGAYSTGLLLDKDQYEQLRLHFVSCTSFDDVARPVMKYLAEKHHPHTRCVIEANSAELVVGVKSIKDDKYLVD